MVNRKYIKQICKEILEMDVENIYFLEKEKRYIIYVNAKIKNTYMDLDIQNIYPLQHNIDGVEYTYNNLSNDEIELLSKIVTSLDITIQFLSDKEYEDKLIQIKKQNQELEERLSTMKIEIQELKSNSLLEQAQNIHLLYKSLIKDMEKIKII